jgi:hypothetical protein
MTVFGFDLARELATEVSGVRIRYPEEPGEEVLTLAASRELARREKDWATADRCATSSPRRAGPSRTPRTAPS